MVFLRTLMILEWLALIVGAAIFILVSMAAWYKWGRPVWTRFRAWLYSRSRSRSLRRLERLAESTRSKSPNASRDRRNAGDRP